MTQRTFPFNVVVTTITGRNVGPFDQYRDFLDHLTGQHVALWDIERARLAARKLLLTNYKALKGIPPIPDKLDSGNAVKYVRDCAAAVGYKEVTVGHGTVKHTPRTLTKAVS